MTTAADDHPGLAIGNAVDGLTAQTAFMAVADLAYRRTNLEHAAAGVTGLAQATLLAILMTGVLLLGMLRRERRGIANIGWESALVLALYAGSIVVILG